MRRTARAAAFAVALLPWGAWAAAPAPQPGETRVALVIGNGDYRDSPLLNPVNDAKAVAQALRGAGFEVIERHDQDAVEMRRAIREFGEKLRGKGAGLFYFAGHGVQVNGRNFLIPSQADIKYEDEIEDQSVDVSLVLSKMESAKARINIVILDACRNNPFARNSRSAQSGLAAMEAPIGSLIAYATSPGQVASDGTGNNGLYTQYLVREIGQPGLKVEDVFKRVRAAVRQASNGRQVPWENTSLEGDFYFRPAERAEPGPTPQEIRRQQEAEIQRAVNEALSRSREEGERERKRLEAAFTQKLEEERIAMRKDALARIAAAEKAVQSAAQRPSIASVSSPIAGSSPSASPPPAPAGALPTPSPSPKPAPAKALPEALPPPRPAPEASATDPSPPLSPVLASSSPEPSVPLSAPPSSAAPAPDPVVAAAEDASKPTAEDSADPVMLAMAASAPDSRPKPVSEAVARGLVPPTLQVGDFWVYQRELRDGEGVTRRNYLTLTVASSKENGYELDSSASAIPFRFDKAGNLHSMAAPGGGTLVIDPVDPLYRYPLEPGASWSARSREEMPGFAKEADSTVTVIGWENVEVPAGKFQAIKISKVAAKSWEPFPGQSKRSKRVSNVWYVPVIRNFARYETLEVSAEGTVLLDQTWELDSFKLN